MITLETIDRYFCSHLVAVRLPGPERQLREIVANIEEISSTGMCLNLEEPLDRGLSLRIEASNRGRAHSFSATVVDCQEEPPMGYYAQLEFDSGCRWSPLAFEPEHLVRIDQAGTRRSAAEQPRPACCERGVCPEPVVSQVLASQLPLTERVRAVGREVASLCGGLTERQAQACFRSLFGAGPECGLFEEFDRAHAGQRRIGPAGPPVDLRRHLDALVRLAGALPAGRTRPAPAPPES